MVASRFMDGIAIVGAAGVAVVVRYSFIWGTHDAAIRPVGFRV